MFHNMLSYMTCYVCYVIDMLCYVINILVCCVYVTLLTC